ncbi:MAG: hypothetical protein Q7J17_02625, partial [Candidatus Deferrimicrobium sp.]
MSKRNLAAESSTTIRVQTESDNVRPSPSEGFISTSFVEDVTERALTYLSVGYAVHFSGPAGVGKTTLAMHVAAKL